LPIAFLILGRPGHFVQSVLGYPPDSSTWALSLFFWIAFPLFVGLIIDAIRHGLELCLSSNKAKACCLKTWVTWLKIGRLQIRRLERNQSYESYILADSEGAFHVWEFFVNTALSSTIAFVVSLVLVLVNRCTCCPIDISWWFLLVYGVLIFVFGGLSYPWRKYQEELINRANRY
jgi:hypothetical protein